MGPTVVEGNILGPGVAVTYRSDQHGVVHWQDEEIFDEDNVIWTGSGDKEEVKKST